MANITVNTHHDAFLQRTARKLSELSKRKVSKREVLHVLIEIAIEDEGVYDPWTSEPISPIRRKVCQAEKEARTASFDIESLFASLKSIGRN